MDRIIGGVSGLAAFTAVIAVGLSKGLPFTGAVGRALLAMVLGYFVGRLIFGWPGLSIAREAAGSVPSLAPVPGDSKPAGTPAKVS